MWTDNVIAISVGLMSAIIFWMALSISPPDNHFDEKTIYDDDEYSND